MNYFLLCIDTNHDAITSMKGTSTSLPSKSFLSESHRETHLAFLDLSMAYNSN